jgi:hypothetical protein
MQSKSNEWFYEHTVTVKLDDRGCNRNNKTPPLIIRNRRLKDAIFPMAWEQTVKFQLAKFSVKKRFSAGWKEYRFRVGFPALIMISRGENQCFNFETLLIGRSKIALYANWVRSNIKFCYVKSTNVFRLVNELPDGLCPFSRFIFSDVLRHRVLQLVNYHTGLVVHKLHFFLLYLMKG